MGDEREEKQDVKQVCAGTAQQRGREREGENES